MKSQALGQDPGANEAALLFCAAKLHSLCERSTERHSVRLAGVGLTGDVPQVSLSPSGAFSRSCHFSMLESSPENLWHLHSWIGSNI